MSIWCPVKGDAMAQNGGLLTVYFARIVSVPCDRGRGAGGRRAVSRVLRGADRQRTDARCVCACGGAVPVVVCGSGPGLARDRPAARGGLYPHASGFGADGETAPGRHPGAVRLAGHPPGAAGESGRGGAGTEARGDQRGDAGADAGRDAVAARWDRPGVVGRSSRPGAAERDGVQLRAGERGRRNAAAGLFPAGDARVAAAAREGRQAARRAGPSPRRGRRRCVSRRRRHRGREGALVPERRPVAPPERSVADAARRSGHDQAPCGGRGSSGVDVLATRSGRRASRRICRTGGRSSWS